MFANYKITLKPMPCTYHGIHVGDWSQVQDDKLQGDALEQRMVSRFGLIAPQLVTHPLEQHVGTQSHMLKRCAVPQGTVCELQ